MQTYDFYLLYFQTYLLRSINDIIVHKQKKSTELLEMGRQMLYNQRVFKRRILL